MADKISKVVLAWSVTGQPAVLQSVGMVQASINNAKKASDLLHDSIVGLRSLDAAKELGAKFGVLAGNIETADDNARQLGIELGKIGASKSEIAAAATEFERFRKAQAELPSFSDEELGLGGAGGRKGQSLGSKIRSLPSVQIPGLGIGTDAIGNLLRVIERIPPAALPAIAALGAVAVAFALISKTVPDVTSGIRQITALDKAYYEARIKGTKDSINAIIEQKKFEQQVAQAQVDNLAFVAEGYAEIQRKSEGLPNVINPIIEVFGALNAANFKDIREARIKYDEAQAALKKANEDLDLYNGLLGEQSTALNTAAEAQKKATEDGIQRVIELAGKQAETQIQINDLIKNGTKEELAAKKKTVEAAKEKALIELNLIGEQLANAKEGSLAQQEYQNRVAELTREFNDADDQLIALNNSVVLLGVKLNDAKEKIEKNNEEIADLIIGYNEDVTKADEDARKTLADIADRYNTALVKAAEDAAKAAEQALQKLNDQAEKLATNLQRDNEAAQRKAQDDALKAAIKFQEQEAKAARDHANAILKIKQDADNREQDLIAARDFAGLFRSRRDTATQISQLNTQYQQEQAERLAAFQQAQADRAQDYANQQRERMIKYQQALEDARKQYNRELAQANSAYIAAQAAAVRARDTQLQIAQTEYTTKLNMLRDHIQRSLALYAQGLDAEEQLRQARTAALLQQAALAAGNFAAPSVQFPGSNSITNNSSSSASFVNNFNISGGNQGLVDLINSQISRTISGYLN